MSKQLGKQSTASGTRAGSYKRNRISRGSRGAMETQRGHGLSRSKELGKGLLPQAPVLFIDCKRGAWGPLIYLPKAELHVARGLWEGDAPGLLGTLRSPLWPPPHLLWALGPISLCIPWLCPVEGRCQSLLPLFSVPWRASFLPSYLGPSNCSLLALGEGDANSSPLMPVWGQHHPSLVVLHSP